MQPVETLSAEDLKAGRLLVQMTVGHLAQACGVSHDTIQRLEAGRVVRAESKRAVLWTLEGRGVRFEGAGYVLRADGPRAPSRVAVGIFHGARIRKARWHLNWTQARLAGLANITVRMLREMEDSRALNAAPSLVFYRVVVELQLAGTVFGPKRHGGVRGDYCLVPRPRLWNPSRHPIRDHALATIMRPMGPRIDHAAWQECVDESVYGPAAEAKVEWPSELERQVLARGVKLHQAREGKSGGDE